MLDLEQQFSPKLSSRKLADGRRELEAPLIPMYVAKGLAQTTPVRVVYPETVTGNPLGAKVVIRWVLNRPGLLAGDRVFDPKKIVFNYSSAYNRNIENPVAGMLYFPTIVESIFHTGGRPLKDRSLSCFYVGKACMNVRATS